MIEVEHIVSVRKPEKPDVIMSRMDYIIICQVIDRLNEIGMSDDELSFLLGKPNNYVFGFIVKPSDKNRFNEDQLDLLPYLLDCPFSRIFVNDTAADNIHLHHTKEIDDDEFKGFSHIVYSSEGKGTRVIWKKGIAAKGSFRKTNDALLDVLIQWVNEGFFDQQKTALDCYKRAHTLPDLEFTISDLEKCIKVLCSKPAQSLQKKSIDGVLRYWRRAYNT